MTNRSAIVGLVVLLVAMGGLLYYAREVQAPTFPNTTSTSQDEAAVRAQVTNFGAQLKNVSLLAPNAGQQLAAAYAPFVAPELLQTWTASTTEAPGRLTSSPWPDRIDIDSVTSQQGAYRVLGNIVEMTNATTTPTRLVPVYMELQNRNGTWLITKWQPNPYTEN
ncbi:MAG TPA: hypothetical protein VIY48_07810 [Candidatus Paceibacterota bacterium]